MGTIDQFLLGSKQDIIVTQISEDAEVYSNLQQFSESHDSKSLLDLHKIKMQKARESVQKIKRRKTMKKKKDKETVEKKAKVILLPKKKKINETI